MVHAPHPTTGKRITLVVVGRDLSRPTSGEAAAPLFSVDWPEPFRLIPLDSPAGIDAALAAGMTAVGFDAGGHCGPEHGAGLKARGAMLVVADIHELAAAIAKLLCVTTRRQP